MAVLNRDLGFAQQRDLWQVNTGAIATGGTYTLGIVPYPAAIATGAVNFFGVSNTPSLNIDVTRYNAAGVTTITGAISALAQAGATLAVGFSTYAGYTLGLQGVTVPVYNTYLQTGDILTARVSGTTANVTGAIVCLVLQALQDVKTDFGV